MKKILLIDGDTIRTLDEAKFIQEVKLQDYLEKYPSLIPFEEIMDDSPELICIGKEVGVPSGSMDLLFIDKNGLLTIVETKLVKNSQIRREVIGQIIEYASYVTQWDADDVYEQANTYIKSNFIEFMQNKYPDNFSAEDFEASIEQNLKKGRLNLIIAVDVLIEPLRSLITFINSHSTFKILILEVSAFEEGIARKVLIPSLFGYVKDTSDHPESKRWNYDKFFKEIQNINNPVIITAINNLYEFTKKYSDELSWGNGKQTGSFAFCIRISDTITKIFFVQTDGRVWLNIGYIKDKIKPEILMAFIDKMNELTGIKISDRDTYPYINSVIFTKETLEKYQEIITWLVRETKSAQQA